MFFFFFEQVSILTVFSANTSPQIVQKSIALMIALSSLGDPPAGGRLTIVGRLEFLPYPIHEHPPFVVQSPLPLLLLGGVTRPRRDSRVKRQARIEQRTYLG
jgi:hypothetical protein